MASIAEAAGFVRGNHRAILITRRRDGSLQTSPVAAGVDDEDRIVISTRETAMKTHNVARDPHVTLCVVSDEWFGPWWQIDGTAEIVSGPEALEPLVEYYRSVAGEHPDWDDYRSAMQRERRVLMRITVDRAGPDRAG